MRSCHGRLIWGHRSGRRPGGGNAVRSFHELLVCRKAQNRHRSSRPFKVDP